MYDVTSRDPFAREGALYWLRCFSGFNLSPHRILVGNKVDQRLGFTSEAKRTRMEALRYAKQYEMNFMETSAKTGLRVQEIILSIAQSVTTKALPKTFNLWPVTIFKEYQEKMQPALSHLFSFWCPKTLHTIIFGYLFSISDFVEPNPELWFV